MQGRYSFAGMRGLSFINSEDVSGRGIERHGEGVARILYYRLVTDKSSRGSLMYLSAGDQLTDYDVVAD